MVSKFKNGGSGIGYSLDVLSPPAKAAQFRALQAAKDAKRAKRKEKLKAAKEKNRKDNPPKIKTKKLKQHKPKRPLVNSDDFLRSYAWRKLRYEALQMHGAECQCCGRSPRDGAVMHVDHIKPRKRHPELALDLNNLQVLCAACNHGKGNWDETDWRMGQQFDE